MAHLGQSSNPLGVEDFLAQIGDEDYQLFSRIGELVKKLVDALDMSEMKYPKHRSGRRLISVAVDGGSQLLFPYFRELSMGVIRVSAYGDDFQEQPKPISKVIKNYEIFDVLGNSEDSRTRLQERRREFIRSLMQEDYMREFSKATGINENDFGEHIYKDIQTFTNTLRSILEWAYIVYISEECKNLKILIARDGRLEQHGVKNEFVRKLKTYFKKKKVYLVGIVKGTKLLREGIPAMVIRTWVEEWSKQHENGAVYFRVPKQLMDYTFGFERQWNPEFEGAFVFGHRYVGKFIPATFRPLQSVFTFDVPFYLADDENAVDEIVSTLFQHCSYLYDGSVSLTSEAHERASIDATIVKTIENEVRLAIQKRANLRIPEEG